MVSNLQTLLNNKCFKISFEFPLLLNFEQYFFHRQNSNSHNFGGFRNLKTRADQANHVEDTLNYLKLMVDFLEHTVTLFP